MYMSDRFYRDKSKGLIGGVCAGLAEYFGVSPVLLRFIFVLWALASGTGVVAYVILWIILPEKQIISRSRDEAFRHNIGEIRSEAREWGQDLRDIFSGKPGTQTAPTNRVILLGGLLVLMGLVFLADSLHLFGWFRLDQLWPIVLILAGIILLNRALRS